jgi:hypothetical protein
VWTSLVPQRTITTRAGQISLVPPAGAFAWSSSTRRSGANRIYGTPLGYFQSDETGGSVWEYLSPDGPGAILLNARRPPINLREQEYRSAFSWTNHRTAVSLSTLVTHLLPKVYRTKANMV